MAKPSLPQGTRDFAPDVVRKRNYIFNTIKNVFELYGFQPLETPAMENLETLMGKYGDEGDKLIYRILNSGEVFNYDFFKGVFDYITHYNHMMDLKRIFELKGSVQLDKFNTDDQVKYVAENHIHMDNLSMKLFQAIIETIQTDPKLKAKYFSKLKNDVSEKALRYDLTIPFARYIAINHKQLNFPFKRYQLQPVWRADRPQKGRYREFYQCDADVVGSNSLLNEVELALIYHQAFTQLGIKNYELKINHRKILTALAELCGGVEKMTDIAIAIDKLDKIGLEKVKEELKHKGLNQSQLFIVEKYLNINGDNSEKLQHLDELLGETEAGKKGIEELKKIFDDPQFSLVNYLLDPTLARGLNYYTGIIFEAKAPAEVKMGSIGGGGRYDDLTGMFGVPDIPGVGISFGVDRIYDVMEELSIFPVTVHIGTQVLFFNLGEEESKVAFDLVQQLRNKNIRCELYHENVKFDKQFKYAEKKNIPLVVIIGSKELKDQNCVVKDISSGKQETISYQQLLQYNF